MKLLLMANGGVQKKQVRCGAPTFWGRDLLLQGFTQVLLFVQDEEGSHAQAFPPQHLHTALGSACAVYHYVVQRATAGRHSYVILGIDGAQVPCTVRDRVLC